MLSCESLSLSLSIYLSVFYSLSLSISLAHSMSSFLNFMFCLFPLCLSLALTRSYYLSLSTLLSIYRVIYIYIYHLSLFLISLSTLSLSLSWFICVYIYMCCKVQKLVQFLPFLKLKTGHFCCFFGFLFWKSHSPCRKKRIFEKNKQKQQKSKNSKVKNWSNHVSQHTWTSF